MAGFREFQRPLVTTFVQTQESDNEPLVRFGAIRLTRTSLPFGKCPANNLHRQQDAFALER